MPPSLYLDAMLLAAWIALLIGMRFSEELAWAMAPLFVPLLAETLNLALLNMVPSWFVAQGVTFTATTTLFVLAYPFAIARTVRRPPHEDRTESLSYVVSFPLAIAALPPFLDAWSTTLLNLHGWHVRALAAALWCPYALSFELLRREGERMRALPKP